MSGAGADYPSSTTCLWSFPVIPRGAFSAAGVRLRFEAFDLEGEDATYALASTTDRVEIWLQDGSAPRDVAPEDLVAESVELGSATLFATISADDFAVGLYEVGAAFDLEFPGYAADAANPVRVAVAELAVEDAPLAEAGPRAELHQGHELVGAARHGLVAAVLAAGPAVERADLDRLQGPAVRTGRESSRR